MPNVDHIFNTPRQATFTPSVATQTFALPFPIYAAASQIELNSDFLVTVTNVVQSGYTITGTFVDGVALDGTLTLASAVSGVTVNCFSRRQPRTSQDLATGGTVTPSELQAMFNAVLASQRDIYDWLANLQGGSPYVPVGTYLPVAGGTMVGDIVLAGDPNANLKPATKQYVDGKFGGAQTWGGLQTLNGGLLVAAGQNSTINGPLLINGQVAIEEQVLTDGANIAWDMSVSPDAGVVLGGNRTLLAPTGRKIGGRGVLRITQDGTGGRSLSLDTNYRVFGGDLQLRSQPGADTYFDWWDTTGTNTGGSIILYKRNSWSVVSMPVVNSTSGTTIDFSIPTWAKRITILLNGVSTSGTSLVIAQIGNGASETTGYGSAVSWMSGFTSQSPANGFALGIAITAADVRNGAFVLTNHSGNIWIPSHIIYATPSATISYGSGVKTTSGVVNFLRITTVNGTDTFDAGFIEVTYEG